MASRCTRSWCERPVRGRSSRRVRSVVPGQDAVARQGGAPLFVIDDVPRSRCGRIEVLAQGQVDLALVALDKAGHDGDVTLDDLAPLELPAQVAVGVGVEGHHHDARGLTVEAVGDPGARMRRRRPPGQAVLVGGPDPRYR